MLIARYNMIQSIMNKYQINKNSYEFDSVVLFAINICIAASNYGIIVIINFFFPEVLASWLAASGLVTIINAPLAGVGFLIVKRFSEISHNTNSIQAKSIFISHLIAIIPFAILFLPFVYIINRFLVPDYSTFSSVLLLITMLSQMLYSFSNAFIMGILDKKVIMLASIAIVLIKVVLSVVFLLLGFNFDALLIAILFSNMGFVVVILYAIIKTPGIHIHKVEQLNFIRKLFKEIHNLVYLSVGVQLLTWMFYGFSIVIDRNFEGILSQTIALSYLFAQILHFGTISTLGGFISHAAKDHNRTVIKKTFFMLWAIQLAISTGIVLLSLLLQYISSGYGRPEWSNLAVYVFWMMTLTMCFNYIFMSVQYIIAKETYKLLLYLIPSSFVMLSYIIIINSGNAIGQSTLIVSSLIVFIATAVLFHLHIHLKKI